VEDLSARLQSHLSDRYRFERELGRGGMATVFLARDLKHDREVAIKVLHPELAAVMGAERFEREIKLAARLQHPHILGLYDSGQADGLLYYVMPFVKGESLRDRLDREGQLPLDDAVQIALEVADALGHAHAQGVVHRDIKPENVLISGGHALVADFGIARAAQEGSANKLTQTGMAIGTPTYMAPEQALGEVVGPTADLYSLGCVLYEMLAGEPPFNAKNAQALMARHSMETVPSVRIVRTTVPEEVEDAIFAAMAKVPADRPKDAAHFAEMLGAPLGSTMSRRASVRMTASRRVPTGFPQVASAQARAWWKRPWAVAVGIVVVGAGGFAVSQMLGKPRPILAAEEIERARQIAVMYFEAEGSDWELRPAADGLTESLIKSLSEIRELTVRSRNAVAPYRETEILPDSVALALDVGTVIGGSLQSAGSDRIRLTTRIWDRAGVPLGDKAILISRDSLFLASESIARAVSELLREVIGKTIELREGQARAGNLAAWRFLQRAEKLRKDAEQAALRNPGSSIALFAQSDSFLGQAILADSRWVDPVLLRGEVALQRARAVPSAQQLQWIQAADSLADHVLLVESDNARASALKGNSRFAEWRLNLSPDQVARDQLLKDAEANLRRAVRADPSLASAYYTLSLIEFEKKDVPASFVQAVNAYTADKFLSNSEAILSRLFYSAYSTDQFREAQKWCSEGETRFPRNPTFTVCHLWLMLIPDAPTDAAKAWRLAARLDSLYLGRPDSIRIFQNHFARMLVGGALGKRVNDIPSPLLDSGQRVMERARADTRVDPRHELQGYEAVMRVQMGELDQAIALLKQYVSYNPDHSFRVGNNVHWWWRPIQHLEGFQALLARQR
jgi:eukaryotic-like serine/threonine-protein kinase